MGDVCPLNLCTTTSTRTGREKWSAIRAVQGQLIWDRPLNVYPQVGWHRSRPNRRVPYRISDYAGIPSGSRRTNNGPFHELSGKHANDVTGSIHAIPRNFGNPWWYGKDFRADQAQVCRRICAKPALGGQLTGVSSTRSTRRTLLAVARQTRIPNLFRSL